ncbi:hypothetical protein [Chitinophaga sp. CF418]|uniref:hypothetical protein n=1 Tax=Chitinophaga sp. CF418 TaxID=1855287 RepID=UPI000914A911|nr:hypothetical protein [Chitinophaga sp. CF418]SHN01628.1 hypothetical protein SAMN05216311_104336 [Chitinophaga sp. CF418]
MKRHMIRISGLLVCLLLALSGTSMAQKGDSSATKKVRFTPEERANKMSDKLDRRLNLSNQQDKDIHTINTDITRRMEEIKHNTTLSKKDKMQQVKTLNEERSQRFKSVLTPEQYKKWNDWEMKKKEQMETRMDKKQQKRNAR